MIFPANSTEIWITVIVLTFVNFNISKYLYEFIHFTNSNSENLKENLSKVSMD